MDPVLIATLTSQALRLVADFQDRAAAGTTTEEEVEHFANRLGLNLAGLKADIAQRRLEDGES